MKFGPSCRQLGMKACCYCSLDDSKYDKCLINKMQVAVEHYGLRQFFIRIKPIIEFAQDDVMVYLIKCIELYYPSDKEKLQSLLTLL